MPPFRLNILGDPVLLGPDGPVTGRTAHRRRVALLAILAVARGRPVGRERLVGLLWPELPGEAARHNLSESLYVLRKELGEGALAAVGSDVALAAGVESDVAEFEEALEAGDREAAARAYGGPLLDGFYVADAPDFERWVEGERDRLARLHARAVEELAEAAEAEGSAIRAVDWWRRLVAHDPFSSRTVLRLVCALDAAGERPSALRAAEGHAALLRAELGVEPDPAFASFVHQLRTGAPREPGVPRSVVRGTSPPSPADRPPSTEAVEEASPSAPSGQRTALKSSERTKGWRRRNPRAMAYGGGLAGVVLGMLLSGLAAPWEDRARPEEPRYDPRRIAVMYFEDLSAGGELQYLANGLTDGLIHELSQVPALDVVSRGGVRPYRERAVRFDSMVADLRAGSVVEGSVQRSRDSVWVTVRLVDANAGVHLQSRRIGRTAGEVIELERALAEEVSASLRRRLGREIRVGQLRRETRSAAATDLVLRAEQLREDAAALSARHDAPDAASADALLLRADSLLAAAEQADPAWTRPVVLRGWVAHARAGQSAGPARSARLDEAARHAARALEREPGSAAALELRGTVAAQAAAEAGGGGADARLAAAEADLRAAVTAEPGRATAWSRLSFLLRVRGKFAESDLAARRALAEDAYLDDAAVIRQRLVFGAMSAGDYPVAREECARGRAQFPADWRFVECALTLLRQDPAQEPDAAEAWRLVAELDRLDPPERARAERRAYSPLYRRMVAAAVSARAGDADSARAVLARSRAAADTSAELRVSLDYDEAYLRVVLGERRAARALLERVLAERPWLRSYVARDPLFRGVIPATPAPTGSSPARPE